jgi:drug/metabolite transporter (DMT)-like permease
MQIKTRGYAALVFGLVTGALVPIVLALATQMSLTEFFLLTYAIGTVFAVLFVLAAGKQREAASYFRQPRKLGLIALMGLLTYLPFGAAILIAERYVSAALATVVFRTSPLLMLIFIPILLRERLSKIQVAALLLAFIGIYVALTGGQLGIVFSNPDLPVLLMLVLASGGYAIASLLMKKYIFDMPSELLVFNVSAAVLFGVAFVATGAVLSPIQPSYVLAMLLVAGDNVIGFYTYFYSFRLLKTTLVTNTYFLSPFLTLLFAGLLLGETIQPYYLLIAVLVTVGLVIQRFDTTGGTYKAVKPQRTRNFVIFDVSGAFADTGEAGIASTLKDGGRVLAVSLPARHREAVVQRLAQGGYSNVFTSEHAGIANEVAFVKDMMSSKPDDMVLLKAGTFEEGEDFFGDMSDLVEPDTLRKEEA